MIQAGSTGTQLLETGLKKLATPNGRALGISKLTAIGLWRAQILHDLAICPFPSNIQIDCTGIDAIVPEETVPGMHTSSLMMKMAKWPITPTMTIALTRDLHEWIDEI